MSYPLIKHLEDKFRMELTLITGFATQAEADKLMRELNDDTEVKLNFTVAQFAAGAYFVVLIPYPPGAK